MNQLQNKRPRARIRQAINHTLGLGLCTAAIPLIALADDSMGEPAGKIEEVFVIAHPLSGEGLSQPSEVLSGAELQRKVEGNIGATLANEPGIHSAQFGTAVGRPVIHGLGGPRVRMMEDRIDTLDVSVTSADHAVTVEPFIADRVEVLKGPSALLYGSGAIGGVVDVHTGRIPHDLPDGTVSGGVETRYDDNTDGTVHTIRLDGGGGQIAWHLDATLRDGDEYEIPGDTESRQLQLLEEAEEEEEEGEEHHDEEGESNGTLPGSQYESENFAGGISFIGDWGFAGISVSHTDAEYGLPGGHHHHEEHEEGEEEEEEEHEEEHEEGTPTLEMKQTRIDLELGIRSPADHIESINVRLGINDYEHEELEPDGAVGTRFSNEAWELRSELIYLLGDWRGAIGLQHTDRDYSAIGEEAFTPPVDSRDSGLFWVAERPLGSWELETGARIGKTRHDPSEGRGRSFNTYSISAGLVRNLSPGWRLGLNADISSRAPVIEELYSNGPHLVTNAFEVGDPDLDNERATSVSATLNYEGDRWGLVATAYAMQFSDFIYEQATGEEEDELPVFMFQQGDADFTGLDLEVSRVLFGDDGNSVKLRGLLDLVRADLDEGGDNDLPRIPPVRYGLGLDWQWGRFNASVDYIRNRHQNRVASFELPTGGYEDIRVYAGVDLLRGPTSLVLFVRGKNLTDDEQRVHTSFIKDVAPAPGRSIEAGLRLLF